MTYAPIIMIILKDWGLGRGEGATQRAAPEGP